MRLITTILLFFGYVRIPLAAVQMSLAQEEALKAVQHILEKNNPGFGPCFQKYIDGQRQITTFLRSARSTRRI